MTTVVTELVIDARGSEAGSAAYIRAMRAAQAAADKLADTQERARVAADKDAAAMETRVTSLSKLRGEWDRIRSSNDATFAAELKARKEIEKVTLAADAAVRRGLTTQAAATSEIAKTTARHNELIAATKGTSVAAQAAKEQLTAYAGSAGTAGQLLAAMGPGGVAAASGIGAAVVAIKLLHDEANKFAADAIKLREFSEIVGLTSVQLQAINDQAAKFAISEDKVGNALQKFSVNIEKLKDGEGDLFNIVRKIDPALAKEMATAKDLATQIDLLGKAYLKAGDSKNALAKAAYGKTGFDIGRLVGSIADEGGMEKLTADFKKSGDAIDKELIDKVAKLKTEIDDMAGDASRNFASIFSGAVLENQKKYVEAWLELSRILKTTTIDDEVKNFLITLGTGAVKGIPILGWMITGISAGATYLSNKLKGNNGPVDLKPAEMQGSPGVVGESHDVPKAPKPSADFLYNTEKERISALGQAATLTEQYRLKQLQLNAALDGGKITQETYNRALAEAGTERETSLLRLRISVLGDLAPVSDVMAVKQAEINKAVQQGAKYTTDEIAAIKEKTRLLAESSKIENQLAFERKQLGRDQTEQTVAATLRSQGIDADSGRGRAIAEQIRLNESLKSGKELATEFTTSFARDFTSQLMAGATAWDSFKNAGLNALQRLADKLVDMAAQNLINKAFGTILGSGGGLTGGNGSASGPVAFMGAEGSNPWMSGASWGAVSANGNVFNAGNVIPFAKGGVVNQPTMAPMALFGEAGPEAIMPLRRGADGKLGVASAGSGSSPTIHMGDDNRVIHIGQGASMETVEQLKAALARDKADRRAQVISIVRSARSARQI